MFFLEVAAYDETPLKHVTVRHNDASCAKPLADVTVRSRPAQLEDAVRRTEVALRKALPSCKLQLEAPHDAPAKVLQTKLAAAFLV